MKHNLYPKIVCMLLVVGVFACPAQVFAQTGSFIIQEDGSGVGPVVEFPNETWVPAGWSFGGTVDDLINDVQFPDLAGSQAAQDLVTALGATNQVITIAQSGEAAAEAMISLNPFVVNTTAGRTFNYDFEQQATVKPLSTIAGASDISIQVIDSLEVQLNDNGVGAGVDTWLWVHMYVLVKRHIPATYIITHEDCKGPRQPDGRRGGPWRFVKRKEIEPAMDVWELVDLSAHFHAFYPDDDGGIEEGDLDNNNDGVIDVNDVIGGTSRGIADFAFGIPTVSTWGMAAMLLLVMVTGTLVFRRLSAQRVA